MDCVYTLRTPNGDMSFNELELDIFLNRNYRYLNDAGDIVFSKSGVDNSGRTIRKFNEYLKANSKKNNPNMEPLISEDGMVFSKRKPSLKEVSATEAIVELNKQNPNLDLVREMDRQEFFRMEWENVDAKTGSEYNIKSIDELKSSSFKKLLRSYCDMNNISEDDILDILRGINGKQQRSDIEDFIVKMWSYQRSVGNVAHTVAELFIKSLNEKNSKGYKMNIKYNKSEIINFIMQNEKFKNALCVIDADGKVVKDKKIDITDTQVELFVSRIHNSLMSKGYLDKDGNVEKDVHLYSELPFKGISKIGIPGSTSFETFDISGVADLIAVKNGNVEIIDWKTGTIQSYSEYDSDNYTYRLNDIKYQLCIYKRLLSNALNIKEDRIATSFIGLRTDNLKPKLTNGKWNGDYSDFEFNGLSVLGSLGEPSYDINWSEGRNVEIQANVDNFILNKTEQPVHVESNIEEWITKFKKDCFGIEADKQTTKEEVAVEVRKNMKKTRDGNFIYEIRYGKSIVKNTEEELINAVYNEINEQENNIKNETSTLRSDIAKCIAADTEYTGMRQNKNTIGKSTSWFNDVINGLLAHNYTLVEVDPELQTILDAHGIILFKNKYTGTIRAEVLISGHPNTPKYNKGNKYITNHLVSLRDESDDMLLYNTKGNIAALETAAILGRIAEEYEGLEAIESIHVMNKYLGVGAKMTNESIWHSLTTIMQYAKIDTDDIGNLHLLSVEGNLRNSIQVILSKKTTNPKMIKGIEDNEKVGTKVLSRLKALEESLDPDSIIKKGNQAIHNELAIELLGLINDFKNTPALQTYRLKSRMESMDPDNYRDIVDMYENLLLAYSKICGYEMISETSYSGSSLKKGLMQWDMIENAGGFTSKTLNKYSIALQRTLNNLKSETYNETDKIWKEVKKLSENKNFNWVKERTFGSKASIYQRLIKFENGDILFKDPDNDEETGDLTSAEKEFLKFTLETINQRRGFTSNNHKYFQVPLKKANLSNMTAGQACQYAKDKISSIETSNVKDKMKNIFMIDDNTVEYLDEEGSDHDIYKATNKYETIDRCTDEERRMIISKFGESYWSTDLESILLSYVFEYKKSESLSKMMAIAEAATVSTIIDETFSNCDMEKKKKFLEEHIEANINRHDIKDKTTKQLNKVIQPIIKLTSSLSLGYNVNQLTYQTLQGVMLNAVAMAKSNSVDCNFGASDIAYAIKAVYGTAFGSNADPTIVELMNYKYGLNAISSTNYDEDVTSNRNGIMNATGKLARKFAARPDFYNRMVLFVAQLHSEGLMDAYEKVDGKLVYNFKKDPRFQHIIKGDFTSPEGKKEYSLYCAIAKDFTISGALDENNNQFSFDPYKDKFNIIPLPDALTERNVTSMKDIGDAIYGYYDDSNKALLSHYFVGSLLFHFRTYWSAKKNQYLAPGGVKLRGQYQVRKVIEIEDGKQVEKTLYWKKATDSNTGELIDDISEEYTTNPDEAYAEVYEWVGEYQEGIIATMIELYNHAFAEGDFLYLLKQGKKYKNGELTEQEKQVYRQQRANVIQLMSDITLNGLGVLLVGSLKDFLKELLKDSNKEDITDAITLDAVTLLINTSRNAFTDFNWVKSILDPVVNDIDPIGLKMVHSHMRNCGKAIFGDETLVDYLENTSSATRNSKYLINAITGNGLGTKEENEPYMHKFFDLFRAD